MPSMGSLRPKDGPGSRVVPTISSTKSHHLAGARSARSARFDAPAVWDVSDPSVMGRLIGGFEVRQEADWPHGPRHTSGAAIPSMRPPGPARAGSGPVVCRLRRVSLKVVVGLGNPGRSTPGRATTSAGWSSTGSPSEPAGRSWAQRDASKSSMGRYRGLDLTLVKPLTYMNDSGHRGPQGPRPRARAAQRPARRRRRLRAAVRQAALPRGRRRGRPQRPALDHRRARQREVQPAPGRDRRSGRNAVDHVLSHVRARRAAAARRAARRRRRRRRGVGARGHEQGRQPLQHVRAAPGRRGPARAARARSTARPTRTASAGRGPAGARIRPAEAPDA